MEVGAKINNKGKLTRVTKGKTLLTGFQRIISGGEGCDQCELWLPSHLLGTEKTICLSCGLLFSLLGAFNVQKNLLVAALSNKVREHTQHHDLRPLVMKSILFLQEVKSLAQSHRKGSCSSWVLDSLLSTKSTQAVQIWYLPPSQRLSDRVLCEILSVNDSTGSPLSRQAVRVAAEQQARKQFCTEFFPSAIPISPLNVAGQGSPQIPKRGTAKAMRGHQQL